MTTKHASTSAYPCALFTCTLIGLLGAAGGNKQDPGTIQATELVDRRSQHLLSLMYRHAQTESNLDNYRSEINFCNNRKINFKIPKTSLTKVNKSPFYQGVRLWNKLERDVQRAITKVKFKTMLKKLGR